MRRYYSHILLSLVLLIPLLIVVSYTTNKANKQADKTQAQTSQTPTVTVLAKNLEVPWALDFLPGGNIIFTERPGRVKILDVNTGQITQAGQIDVLSGGEAGLLGIAVHPQFATNNYVYVYYTYDGPQNRLARYTLVNNQLTAPTTIVDAVPGATTHDGGRIKFGPDGFLYIATGDGQTMPAAQDPNSLAGKVLRVTDTGQPAPGNPFNNRTYSYGHRNPQGLTWIGNALYETEHGNSHPSRSDEVNLIEPGKNYGWPDIEGDAQKEGMVRPLLHSGNDASTTWAPSGTAYWNGSIFFGALKGQGLYEVAIQGTTATLKAQHLKGEYGRIREAIVGPDNQLYITTSNRDGRGQPKAEDDKILKVSFGTPSTAPSLGVANPTFGVIAPCPSCTNPPVSTLPSQPMTGGVTPAPTEPMVSTQPTDPCQASDVSIAEDNTKKHRHHKKHSGGVSNLMNILIEFLLKLLELLIQLLGGGQINLPNPTPEPPGGTSPDPCVPSVAPAPTVGPSSSVAVPSTPYTPVSTAPAISAPATTVSQPAQACIQSGQKCDPTGARQCCTNACVKNINPNFPDDPGTCD